MAAHPFIFGAGPNAGGLGGGGSIAVAVSDATPDFGDTITITATATGFVPTQYQFLLFNGSVTLLAQQVGNTLNWTVNVGAGNYDVYVLATDGSINRFGLESIIVTVLYQPETIAYMTAIAVPADGTLYYPSTIYERTGLQLWQAFNAFVVTGKAAGWWSTLIAFYPYIGGTATAHKFNAVNPVDTNVDFRAQFFGSVTHSATGVEGNGVNGYANTFFNDSAAGVDRNNFGITMYSRTASVATGADMGAVGNVPSISAAWLWFKRTAGSDNVAAYDDTNFGFAASYVPNSQGSFTVTRQTAEANTQRLYRNGALVGSRPAFAPTPYTNQNIFLMCRNVFGGPSDYSSRNYSAHAIHNGMTAANVASFHAALQTLQTALGRQV